MGSRPPLLLSVDFEDWHQLVRRRVGAPGWEAPGPALGRQTEALLALLAELGARATFFVLGMAARAHPRLVQSIGAAGHEIACHGDGHLPVYRQSPTEFAADLRRARETIAELAGSGPLGYRAPAFSITRGCAWAYDVLAEHGFAYDASHHDTPLLRDRTRPPACGPHRLPNGLWEFPAAVWRLGPARAPVGGPSYWAATPTALIVGGLRRAGPYAGLYLHPYDLDPEPLQPNLAPGASVRQHVRAGARAARRNAARRRAPRVLRRIAERFALIPYGEAYVELCRSA